MNVLANQPDKAKQIPYIKLVRSDRDTGIDISKYFLS
jgi:hypothetical protein